MIYNVNELRKETVDLIKLINAQIAEVEKTAQAQGIDKTMLRDGYGNLVMIPLLTAKATAYNTLVMLQADVPRRGR